MNDEVQRSIGLLAEAIRKQFELRENPIWTAEIPELCPPVLWFGNHMKEELIVTVGANPSRWEFLDRKTGDYLVPAKQRFYHFRRSDMQSVLEDEATMKQIIQSYDLYFHRNPYALWFGKRFGGKVEGFLNGLGASLYSQRGFGAVHTDLIPFVTMNDFSKLDGHRLQRDLFLNRWAQNFLNKLLNHLQPVAIMIFGRNNFDHYNKLVNRNIILDKNFTTGKNRAKYCVSYKRINGKNIPLIGLNINLGNPVGFSRQSLLKFGSTIKEEFNLGRA